MNHLEAVHRVFRPFLTPLTSALALLSIVACGVFSSDATPAPPSTAPPTSPPASASVQTPSPGSMSTTAAEDSELYRAIWTNDVDTVKKLVAEGTDVNAKDEDGDPFLLEAIWRDHAEVVQVLVDAARTQTPETRTTIRSYARPYGVVTPKSRRFSSTRART